MDQPGPSARDPSFNETNPRRDEMRSLGLRNRPWIYALTAVAIIGVVIALFWIARPTSESVPGVTGRPLSEAFAVLDDQAVCVEWIAVDRDARPGQVSGQNPQGGSEWASDTHHVRLIVGPRTDIPAAIAEVPDIACENAHDDLRRHP